MKTTIIITNSQTQIDLVPETDSDKAALSMMKEGQTMTVGKAIGYEECIGGHLRPFAGEGIGFTFVTATEDLGQ